MSISRCIEHIKRNIITYTVVFISAYAFYLRIAKLAKHTLWADELCQIDMGRIPFLTFITTFPRREFCAYVAFGDYLLTYPFSKVFGLNKWGLAIPHVISTVLGFYFLYLICKLHFKTIGGYIVTFVIVCFNATLINHATEIRVYAVLPTLALAVFYFSQILIDRIDMSIKKKLLLGVFFVGAIWFHPYGIVMVFLSFVYSLGVRLYTPARGIIFRKNLIFLTVILCISMPLWLFGVFGPHHTAYIKTAFTFTYIDNPLINMGGFLKAVIGNLIGNKKLYFLIIGVIFPFLVSYKERFAQIGFLFIIVFMPVQLILLSDLYSGYWFIQRQFIWVMPFFAFFLGWAWDSFFILLKRSSIKKMIV